MDVRMNGFPEAGLAGCPAFIGLLVVLAYLFMNIVFHRLRSVAATSDKQFDTCFL
jgi:hypothetical protein